MGFESRATKVELLALALPDRLNESLVAVPFSEAAEPLVAEAPPSETRLNELLKAAKVMPPPTTAHTMRSSQRPKEFQPEEDVRFAMHFNSKSDWKEASGSAKDGRTESVSDKQPG
jgi:hypothetical protein